jgi:hypothetical protein
MARGWGVPPRRLLPLVVTLTAGATRSESRATGSPVDGSGPRREATKATHMPLPSTGRESAPQGTAWVRSLVKPAISSNLGAAGVVTTDSSSQEQWVKTAPCSSCSGGSVARREECPAHRLGRRVRQPSPGKAGFTLFLPVNGRR